VQRKRSLDVAEGSRGSGHRGRSKAQSALQLALPIPPGWGGRRAGAGRPPGLGRRQVPHRSRPAHSPQHPVHVTLRSACRSLRTQFVFPTVRKAIFDANSSSGERFRVAHFSVQGDHLHLIVEALSRRALLEGVRGLSIRIARRVNQLLSRRGRFFTDRWHGRALSSPRAVRNALVYVLANFRKHRQGDRAVLDVYSSAVYFPDFLEFPSGPPIRSAPQLLWRGLAPPAETVLPCARTWLLSTGWKRHGRLSVAESPAH